VALVKYWGKRDDRLVLPHTGSLSLTLDALVTETSVTFGADTSSSDEPLDRLLLDDVPAGEGERRRCSELLGLIRARVPGLGGARVESRNSFPTASGLASSASGFAALAAAAAWAAGLQPTSRELSILARQGSGSACRSVPGGVVEWTRGERIDGEDSFAQVLLEAGDWPLAVAVAIVEAGRKETGSRDAMATSVATSPKYPAWIVETSRALEAARVAVERRDLEALGTIAEANSERMHAVAASSDPPVIFRNATTFALLERVSELRRAGLGAWATVDAGPHVFVVCEPGDLETVSSALRAVGGVREVVPSAIGPGVERI